ncbi:MAG: hypothetical protein K8S87_05770 [Planctomycetes bacterium]|nr:hypothetical protein [Planctomycetota bacterium]
MRIELCIVLLFLLMFLGCSVEEEFPTERDMLTSRIEKQKNELDSIFSDEILVRHKFKLLQNPDLMSEKDFLVKIDEINSRKIHAETLFALKLRKYYKQFKYTTAYNEVVNLYIMPKIKIIHDLKRFAEDIKRKQIISEMIEEYKKGKLQDKQVLRFLQEYKKGRPAKYTDNSIIDSESSILFNEIFNVQYSIIEKYIGAYLTQLQRDFSDFEEVREIDDEIVRPYYKQLISSLPKDNKKLTKDEKAVLHGHLSKIKKLFPYSDLTVKAERKLIPLTAKKQLSELTGTPLIFFLLILMLITFGYTLCLRGYLKHKQSELEVSEVYKPIADSQSDDFEIDNEVSSRIVED